MSSEPYRALCIRSLNPDASDDDITESLLELLKDFKFISAKVLCEPGEERTAFAVFRYVEDAKEAFAIHKDMQLCGKSVDVSPVPVKDPIMDTLPFRNKAQSRPEREPRFTPRGRGGNRRFRRGRGGPSDFRQQHNAPYKKPFPGKHKFHPPSRHLFVGSIAPCTSEEDLRRIFEQYGFVLSVDRKTSYAFVKFFTIDMALRAKKAMHGKLIAGVACKIGFGTSSPTPCLYVGRIGPWTDEKEIVSEFSQFGKVIKFEWPRDKKYAYVLFDRTREAQDAYENLQGMPLGRQNKRILLDFADECQIESSLNFKEPGGSAADLGFNDEADWNEFDDCNYLEEDDDAEFARSKSPGSYDYDRYASGLDRREDHYERSPVDEREWHDDRDMDYSAPARDWRSRGDSRSPRGHRRGNWRGYRRNNRDSDRTSLRQHRLSSERDTRRFESHYERDDRRIRRDEPRGYERDDRQSHGREDRRSVGRGERLSYERDRRSCERDRRSYERDRRSYERDDQRRDSRRSPDRDSVRARKRDRSAGSGRSFERNFRDRRSRSRSVDRSHRKWSRRSSDRSPERKFQNADEGNRMSSERNFALQSSVAGAIMPNLPIPPNQLPPLNLSYPPPAFPPSTAVYPPNPMSVYPQPSIVPAYQSTLPDPFPSASVTYYPSVSQPLPDFSVPPPPLRSFSAIVSEPLAVTPSILRAERGSASHDIASRFPVVWSGALVLKNSAFVTNMYLLSGSVLLVDALLRDQSADCPVLKITQRLRLDEPDKVKEIERRVNMSGRNGCSVLLAVPASAEVGDVNNIIQQRPLTTLGSYLREKAVAAVILLPPGSTAGSQTGILHAFPPCDFAREFLKREAPELAAEYPKDDHLLVIVMRETGD